MKRYILISMLAALAAITLPSYSFSLANDGPYALGAAMAFSNSSLSVGVSLDFRFYYNYLGDYGRWVNVAPYGYVWCPRHMGRDWRPYTRGHWVWTEYGWTWISDEEWGWIAFHYGRWGWGDDVGWYWVPGTTWAPAWVSWRYNDHYCGWAPLPPGFEFQSGVDFRAVSINIPGRFWIFVQGSHFLDQDVRSRAIPYERNTTIINSTTVYNNIQVRNDSIINEGIGVDNVRRMTKRDVPRYSLSDAERPGQARISGRQVQIYRPALQVDPSAQQSVAPNTDNARSRSARAEVMTEQSQPVAPRSHAEVRKQQEEDRKLVQQTQSRELKDMKRMQSEEMSRAKTATEKEQVKREYQSKVSELKKSHQEEKKQMAERHKRDTKPPKAIVPNKEGAFPEQSHRRDQ